MNKSLIIIAVSAILVLLLILKFVVRDNINSGDDAVYGPKGTDDLPVDPMANLKDTYKRSVLKNIKKTRNDATNSDTVETFKNINEMYPGYSEDNYAEFQN